MDKGENLALCGFSAAVAENLANDPEFWELLKQVEGILVTKAEGATRAAMVGVILANELGIEVGDSPDVGTSEVTAASVVGA